MNIRASAEIRLNYNKIADECKETGQPIYLTRNGQGELVVQDIASYERERQELKAQQLVLEAFANRLAGAKTYSNDEAFNLFDKLIKVNK